MAGEIAQLEERLTHLGDLALAGVAVPGDVIVDVDRAGGTNSANIKAFALPALAVGINSLEAAVFQDAANVNSDSESRAFDLFGGSAHKGFTSGAAR